MRVMARRSPTPPALMRYIVALGLNGQADAALLELRRLRNVHGEKHYSVAIDHLSSMIERYPQLATVVTHRVDSTSR